MERKGEFIRSSDCRSSSVRVLLLEACEWLKCGEDFDWLANDGGESYTVLVSGRNSSGNFLQPQNSGDHGS